MLCDSVHPLWRKKTHSLQLLIRDPVERLGGGEGDADEIKAHPFFASINWDDLEAQRVPPPFVPELSVRLSVSCSVICARALFSVSHAFVPELSVRL